MSSIQDTADWVLGTDAPSNQLGNIQQTYVQTATWTSAGTAENVAWSGYQNQLEFEKWQVQQAIMAQQAQLEEQRRVMFQQVPTTGWLVQANPIIEKSEEDIPEVLKQQVEKFAKEMEKDMSILSGAWTGEKFTGEVMDRPKIKSEVPQPEPVLAGKADLLEEYSRLASELGMRQPHLEIELFRQFLEKNGIAVFPLPAVIAYMDKKASQEATANSGWVWRPLRHKDAFSDNTFFGKIGRQKYDESGRAVTVGQSDYYGQGFSGNKPRLYDHTIPLHALRKVAAITKEFGEKVKLFVSDYAPLETIVYPDPFLMAVVPNPALNRGVGRFVIDFWDEPGFGLEQQLGLKK